MKTGLSVSGGIITGLSGASLYGAESTSTSTGALTISGGIGLFGSVYQRGDFINLGGALLFNRFIRGHGTITNTSTVVNIDWTNSGDYTSVFRANSNLIVNIYNLTTTTVNVSKTVTVLVHQTSTARNITGFQINGTTTPINWQGGTTFTGAAGKIDIAEFTLMNLGTATNQVVLGSYTSYG